jgi:hypothetical protein
VIPDIPDLAVLVPLPLLEATVDDDEEGREYALVDVISDATAAAAAAAAAA